MASTIAPAFPSSRSPQAPVLVPVESLPQPSLREVIWVIPARARRILPAWIMLGICVSLGLVMATGIAYMTVRDGFATDVILYTIWGPLFACTAVTGVLILQEYPGHRVGWVVLLAGFTWVTAHTPYFYGEMALTRDSWELPAGAIAMQLGFFYPIGLYLLLVELPLIFPSGRLTFPWWQAVRVVGLAGAASASWAVGFGTDLVMFGIYGDIENPWYLPGPVTDLVDRTNGFDILFAMGMPAVISMILRLRRATGVERMQLRWIAWVAMIVVLAYAVHSAGHQEWIARHIPEQGYWLVFSFWGLALNAIGIVVGLAILRLRLYDIDIVIHRTVLYTALVTLIAVAYVVIVSLINLAVGQVDAENPRLWVTSITVAAIVALLVHPLRSWLQGALNRWLFGSRDDPGDILTRLGVRLELALAPAEVLGEVTRTTKDLLRLPHAAVAMVSGHGLDVMAESGEPGREQACIPLVYQHERIGELRVTPRSPGEGFSRADREVLESIARQTAVAAYGLRVTGDLQRARERLVTTREEERRRLRRDLHDGLGAQLAALTIQAGTVRRNVRDDPGRAERDLDHIQAELRSAISDVRRLVHGLRPPALDEFGLVAALRSRMLAFEGETGIVETHLDVSGDDRPLPAAIEVAMYRIVEEALTNSSRHGRARSVVITLRQSDVVRLSILDDGSGLPASYEPGVGIHSMRERAEELGGTFDVTPRDSGGVSITVVIPLAPPGAS